MNLRSRCVPKRKRGRENLIVSIQIFLFILDFQNLALFLIFHTGILVEVVTLYFLLSHVSTQYYPPAHEIQNN